MLATGQWSQQYPSNYSHFNNSSWHPFLLTDNSLSDDELFEDEREELDLERVVLNVVDKLFSPTKDNITPRSSIYSRSDEEHLSPLSISPNSSSSGSSLAEIYATSYSSTSSFYSTSPSNSSVDMLDLSFDPVNMSRNYAPMMIPINYVDVPMPMQYYAQYQQPNYVPYYQQQQHYEPVREEIYSETHSIDEFCAELKLAEKSKGYRGAIKFAQQYIAQSSPHIQWKMFLELAELSRKESHFTHARRCFEQAVTLQPSEVKAWLEWAKMEEENGELMHAESVLLRGMEHCALTAESEALIVKALRVEEKCGHVSLVRHTLSALRHVDLSQHWRVMLEGALFELRAGRVDIARHVITHLTRIVPWSGALYVEGLRLESRAVQPSVSAVLSWLTAGLQHAPSYSPLYFTALSLIEQDGALLSLLPTLLTTALQHLSRELWWKLYLELALIDEKFHQLTSARTNYVKAALNCPKNLVWRVWVQGARFELTAGNTAIARRLLIKAVQQVPEKMRSVVYLECAHLEEYIGNSDRARYIVDKAKKELSYEWKLYLERVLIDVRAKRYDSALQLVKSSLNAHPCTGRLWALYIQLELLTSHQFARAWRVFKQAVHEVPKAGEVWCEGGRLALMARDTATARLFFERAIEFTPQYGDSFVEWLRVELLTQGPAADLSRIEHAASCAAPNYGVLWSYCKTHPSEGAVQTMHNARRVLLDLRHYELSMNLCHALNVLPVELLTADERKRLIFGWL